MNTTSRNTQAAAVPKAVIVVVPVMFTNCPVAVARFVVAALAMSAPCVESASMESTAVACPVPPFAIGRVVIVFCLPSKAV